MKLVTKLTVQHKFFWALYLPVFFVSTLASFFLLSSRFNDLDDNLYERTEHITEQVAVTGEYAIVFSDQNMMQRILQMALNHQDISSVQIFNSEQSLIAEMGKPPTIEKTFFPNGEWIEEHDDFLQSVRSIHYSSSPIDDTFNTQNRLSTQEQRNLVGWVKIEVSKSVNTVKKYQFVSIILFTVILFNLLAIIVAIRLSNRLTQPINQLSGSLKKLIKGQFSTIKLMQLPPEYADIQKDLLDLTERLEFHNEELIAGIEQSTEDIRRSMDSMEEKSAQLHIANREAMESNRLKSQFLANISHEVRTPLNAILGYTKTLKKDLKDAQQRLYVETIQQSTNSLLAIIGDILDFSKIEAGKLNLESAQFNLKSLVEEVYQTLSINLLSKKKQIDLIPEFDPNLPDWLIGDSTRVRQILTNLIGNAIKFTHQGSIRTQVSLVSINEKDVTLSFKIIDTGIGIAEHKINKLFKPFSQVDTSTSRQFGGTGLGLVITKKLVEQMNGKIEVSSDPSIGSTFRFTLNLKVSPKLKQSHSPLDYHVILLEPSNTYKSYMKQYLEDIGVVCTLSADFEQVITLINKGGDKPNAILLSVAPDKQSVLEAKELISYAYKELKVVCILLIQPPGQIEQYSAIKNLCSDILLKPVSQERLYQALQNINNTDVKAAIANRINNTKQALEYDNTASSESVINDLDTEVFAEHPLKGVKILAVDDSPINLQLLGHWLEPQGLEISLAYSGKEAIELAQKTQYDLILMDIQMPEMDGMETTRHLRALDNYIDTPIIALTAHALGSEQKEILASGMNAYLTKPIDEEVLFNTIEKWHLNTDSFQDQVDAKLANIFDLDKALDIVDGKTHIAKDMFDMLADSLDSEKKLIRHHLEQQDTKKLIEVVHRVHGASKYTGTINIARHAGFLETHLKELGLEDVEGVADDFIEAIEDLLSHRELIPWPESE